MNTGPCGRCGGSGWDPRETISGPPVPCPECLQRRSIPHVSPEVSELAGQLYALHWACEEVAAYLPVGRVPWERLAELADMLEAITPDVRRLVERMVVEGDVQTPRG